MMIFHHAFGFLYRIPESSPLYGFVEENNWLQQIALHGKVCVPAFLFVTGVGLASAAQKDFFRSLAKSFVNFEKIYLPSVVIGSALLFFFPVEYPDGAICSATLKNFAMAVLGRGERVCGEWWYARIFLFSIFVFFPIFRFLFSRIEKTFLKTLLLSAAICAFFATTRHWTGTLVPAFTFGYFVGTLNFSTKKPLCFVRRFQKSNHFLCNAVAILIFLIFAAIDFKIPNLANHVILLPAIVLLSTCLGSAQSAPARIFRFLGKYSGLMWLNHSFILYYYLRQELYQIPSVLGVFLAATLLSLLVAIVMRRLIFAFPWDALLGKIPAFSDIRKLTDSRAVKNFKERVLKRGKKL